MVAQEKAVARAVMLFGLPTPLVGTLYEDGDRTALDFERIPDKRSFSRIIAEEPEQLETITRRFAKMCRKLHETPCDTTLFQDRVLAHRQVVINCKELTDAEKEPVLAFVDSIPRVTTCLHGDLQMSNVITTVASATRYTARTYSFPAVLRSQQQQDDRQDQSDAHCDHGRLGTE